MSAPSEVPSPDTIQVLERPSADSASDIIDSEESEDGYYEQQNDVRGWYDEYGTPLVKAEPEDSSEERLEMQDANQEEESSNLDEESSNEKDFMQEKEMSSENKDLLPENKIASENKDYMPDNELSSENSNSTSTENFDGSDPFTFMESKEVQECETVNPETVEVKASRARSRKPKKPLRSSVYHKCKYCSYTTTNHSNMVRHEQRHLGTRPYACTSCDYAATTNSELKKHEAKHSEEKPFKCDKCPYSARQASDLVVHDKIHAGIRPYKCQQCDYAGVTSNKLKRHMRVHSESRPYICSLCDYSCKDSSRLKEHLRIHNGIKPYKCPYCEHKAVSHANLRRHRATHTGIKPNKCPICDYTCIRPSDLRLHMRKHTGEKPFSCHLCDFSASSHSNLRRHQYVHTGQKPHKCEICEYSCTNRSRLKEHMRVHTGQKPYTCSICGYKCSQSSILNSHRKRKHQHELNAENMSQESPETVDSSGTSEKSPDRSVGKDLVEQATTLVNMESKSETSDVDPPDYSDRQKVEYSGAEEEIVDSNPETKMLIDNNKGVLVDTYEQLDKICVARGNSHQDNTEEPVTNDTSDGKEKRVKTTRNYIIENNDEESIIYSHKLKLKTTFEDDRVEDPNHIQNDITEDGKVIKTEPAFVKEPENAYYPW